MSPGGRVSGLRTVRKGEKGVKRMRHAAVLFAAVAAATVFASAASAAEPTISTYSVTGTATLSGVCSFDVSVTANVTVTEIDYFNADGSLDRIYFHTVEQDTFSANGKSITGEPYTGNSEILFDSTGAVTHIYGAGVAERIVLPDGTFFLSAGRSDFINHPEASFLLSPDVGHSGDVAAFCAALS
jgi:hypothetical protein